MVIFDERDAGQRNFFRRRIYPEYIISDSDWDVEGEGFRLVDGIITNCSRIEWGEMSGEGENVDGVAVVGVECCQSEVEVEWRLSDIERNECVEKGWMDVGDGTKKMEVRSRGRWVLDVELGKIIYRLGGERSKNGGGVKVEDEHGNVVVDDGEDGLRKKIKEIFRDGPLCVEMIWSGIKNVERGLFVWIECFRDRKCSNQKRYIFGHTSFTLLNQICRKLLAITPQIHCCFLYQALYS